MQSPLVSICIPTYNRPDFLLKALDSCFKQTYKNYEIVITDNSSDNRTKQAILALKNNKIRYYKNSHNIGSFKNLQKTASLAKGKYIKFLLDDDLLHPECLKRMVSVMENYPSVGVVMAPLDIVDSQGNKTKPIFYLVRKMPYLYKYLNRDTLVKKEKILDDFLTKVYPCCVPTGIMFRKKTFDDIGGFDENFQYITDLEICMRFAKHCDFYYIDQFLSSWRYTFSSETIAIVHQKGIELNIFYRLLKKYQPEQRIIKQSYFFASKRTSLNVLAGIKSFNLKLVIDSMMTIWKNDPYFSNKIKLPFSILWEILKSLAK